MLCIISVQALAAEPFLDPDDYFDGREEAVDSYNTRQDRGTGVFGNFGAGVLTHSIGSGDDAARASVIQTDGRIVLAGRFYNGSNNDFLVVRLNPDGSLDTSFFTTGSIRVSFGGGDEIAHGMALQTDGKLLVAGRTDLGVAGQFDFAVARFNADGSLDTTFNSSGKRTLDIASGSDFARGIAFDGAANAAVIAGYVVNGGNFNAAVIRLASNGQWDTAFATSGKVITALNANDNGALAVDVFTGGVAIGGHAYNGTNWDLAVARYLSNGILDTAFHSSGFLTTTIGTSHDRAFGVLIDTANQTLLVGQAFISGQGEGVDGFNNLVVARYTVNGDLDTTFDTNGYAVDNNTLSAGWDFVGNGIRRQTDGKIWVAGAQTSGTNDDIFVARYLTDGALDTAFATTGIQRSDVDGSGSDVAQALAMRGDGYFIAVGRAHNGTNFDLAVIRYNTDGSLAPSGGLAKYWGTGGYQTVDVLSINEIVTDAKVQTDGKIVAIGGVSLSGTGFITRFNLDGTLDTSFFSSGKNTTQVISRAGARVGPMTAKRSLVIGANGGAVVGGSAATAGTLTQYTVNRFNTDGSYDTTFDRNGGVNRSGVSGSLNFTPIQVSGDGSVLVGGDGPTNGFGLARFSSDGQLDTSFYTSGLALIVGTGYTMGKEMLATPSGEIYVIGSHSGADDHIVLRYLSNGVLDTSFNTGFVMLSNTGAERTYAILMTSSGRLLLGGDNSNLTAPVFLLRTDGTLETSFNSTGKVQEGGDSSTLDIVYDLAETPNGRYIGIGNDTKFMFARWNSNGILDTTFATDGAVSDTTFGAAKGQALVITNEGLICGGGSAAGATTDFLIVCLWQ